MNKKELIELLFTKEERSRIDIAYPKLWADNMRDMGLNPQNYIWMNDAPVHLGDKLIEKFCNYTDDVWNADLDDEIKAELVRAFNIMKGGMEVS